MLNAKEMLDQYYLEMRWRCLSLAADLDRVQRAAGGEHILKSDPRLAKLRDALAKVLEEKSPVRAEAVQNIFTDRTPPPSYGRKSQI